MSQKSTAVALRASILYGITAGVWILFSDRLLGEFITNQGQLTRLEIFKGWVFVLFTAAMLFLIMRQLLRREAQKIEELKQADARTRLQNQTLQMIANGRPMKDTLEVLVHGIEALSPDMLVSILLLDADGIHLRHGAAPSLPEEFLRVIDGAAIGPKAGSCGTAAYRGSPVFVSDIANDPLWADYKYLALPHRLRSCWSTPILDEQKKVVGTFAIYRRQTGLPGQDDVQLIEQVTHTAAMTIGKDRVEKTLRNSEERFRTLVQQASDAFFVHDHEGRLLDVNPNACESLGYSRKELLRMTVADFEEGVDLPAAKKIWQQLALGQSQIVRGRHRRKDGTVFPVEVNVTACEIQGQLVLAALSRNISKRKEYENQLAQSVSLLRATIESSASGLLVVNTEGHITTYNNRFLELWSIPPELVAQSDDQALLKAGMEQIKEPAQFLRRVQELYQHPEEESYDTIEFKDGRIYDRVSRPQRLGDRIIGRVWSFRDVTSQKQAEKSMRLQSVALETAANSIVITDQHGNIEWVNPAFTASSGYTMAECVGKNPRELVNSGRHDKEFFRAMWQTILAGKVWHGEITNRRKDGCQYLEEMTITPLNDEQNRITHFVAIKQDITQRRQMEESLWNSSQMLNLVLENMPIFVFWKDRNGVYLGCNPLFAKNAGLNSPEEIIGRSDLDLPWEPAETECFRADDQSVMETGQPKLNYEEPKHTADGRAVWLRTNKIPLRNAEGEIIGILGTFEDITERKHAEEQLRQAMERTQFYMNRMPQAFIAWNRDFQVAEWNHAAEEIFGWSAAEAMGQHAYKLIVPPEIQPQVDQVWSEIIRTGNMASDSVNENITKSGRRIICEWRNTPWRDATGQICGCFSIVTDITERRHTEMERQNLETQLRQSQKMEAVGQLSGGIAHDFNNILTVIQGNAAMLQEFDLQPAQIRDCSNQIARAGERAASLTRQLLMFARKQQMQLAQLDLNETVAQMTKMLQRILGEDIALRSEYSPALPPIRADVGMIEQIILNLAVNARDAMPGGGKLTIRTRAEKAPPAANPELPSPAPTVCLSVTDTGTGIPPEILPRIFEPFFTTKEVGKGTGLGLATVYGIVQQHRGEITVQSEIGKGTTFTVHFPAVTVPDGDQAAAPAKPVLPRGDETILLVEDEFPLRNYVSELLKHCGYTVLEAESGPAALNLWREHRDRIQLVFTDIIMPENLNGIDLGRRLLAEKPALKIIYTSGYTANLEGRHRILVEGVNFIRKPFKPQAIAEMIRKNLDDQAGANKSQRDREDL